MSSIGPENMMGGGSGIPILMFTPAHAGIGARPTKAESIIPTNVFFIMLPSFAIIFR